jgi:hypothetical protein
MEKSGWQRHLKDIGTSFSGTLTGLEELNLAGKAHDWYFENTVRGALSGYTSDPFSKQQKIPSVFIPIPSSKNDFQEIMGLLEYNLESGTAEEQEDARQIIAATQDEPLLTLEDAKEIIANALSGALLEDESSEEELPEGATVTAVASSPGEDKTSTATPRKLTKEEKGIQKALARSAAAKASGTSAGAGSGGGGGGSGAAADKPLELDPKLEKKLSKVKRWKQALPFLKHFLGGKVANQKGSHVRVEVEGARSTLVAPHTGKGEHTFAQRFKETVGSLFGSKSSRK